ncbi:TPA: methyltransferase domain-containing protein [Streptococcus agalactiae]
MFHREDFSKALLKKALQPGMRVMDIGCGSGELTRLAADIVGKEGDVVGIDINEQLLWQARHDNGYANVSYQNADLAALSSFETKSFDAIIGRRVLMYQKDPKKVIESLTPLLKPNGFYVFQESDAMCLELAKPSFVNMNKIQSLIWQTVEKEGGHSHIGSQLEQLMLEAGLIVDHFVSENVIQTSQTGTDLSWLLNIMKERIQKYSDLQGLEDVNLQKELEENNDHFIRDCQFGIISHRVDE